MYQELVSVGPCGLLPDSMEGDRKDHLPSSPGSTTAHDLERAEILVYEMAMTSCVEGLV